MWSRRAFLGILPALGGAVALRDDAASLVAPVIGRARGRTPEDLASDEDFWRPIQQAYTVDRNLVNFNNGGVSPSPRIVQESMKRALDESHTAPAFVMWRRLEKKKEQVRQRLARMFGCSPEEIAITRNASEALETLIFGLDLSRGDEVLASDHNYPRMIQSWRQRALRDGIVLKTFPVPTNPKSTQELIDAYASRITKRTRVMEVCQVTNRNGQIWPVRELCRLGREHGIEVIVDGAHAFGHFPFTRDDLECDYYGTSLHKWLCAPHGTGFLYVKKEKIRDVWPLMAAPDPKGEDIRKFEEIGTHPAANHNAIAEAITFHLGIGAERKAARLRHLNRRWIAKIEGRKGARLLTNDADDQSCGLRLLSLPGMAAAALSGHLIKRWGMITSPISHPDFDGIRVTPHVYTTPEEVDRFIDAIHTVQDEGLPE